MNADVILQDLVTTLDKRETAKLLREWRDESKHRLEVNLINDLLEVIESGELDG